MANQPRDEKTEEKQEEKQEEKGRAEKEEEKRGGEKWQRNPVGAAVWAAILIWAGVVLFAATTGVLGRYTTLQADSVIFVGAGIIVIAGGIFRVLVPSYRRPVAGAFILGIILIAIGLGSIVGWQIVGPLALVLIGVYLFLRSLTRRR